MSSAASANHHHDFSFAPDAQRFLALSWETNFVQMPPSESRVKSAAFDEMKKNVADE
jgi:hypothetical protein